MSFFIVIIAVIMPFMYKSKKIYFSLHKSSGDFHLDIQSKYSELVGEKVEILLLCGMDFA